MTSTTAWCAWPLGLLLLAQAYASDQRASTCYGTPERGRLEDGMAVGRLVPPVLAAVTRATRY